MKKKILVFLMLLLLGNCTLVLMGQNDYWFQKGVKAKKPVKKIEYFTKSIEIERVTAETYLNRGDVYWSLANDAISNPRSVVIVFDKDKAGFHDAKLMLGKARKDYTKAIEIDSNCTKAYIQRSIVYRQLGENDEALADLSQLIKISPDYTEAYYDRGYLYRNHFRDPEKALVDFSKAIKLDPNNKNFYLARGHTYYHLGEREKALADYNKMIEIDPTNAYSYRYRGDIYRGSGEYDKAISDYNRSLKIDSKNFIAYNNRGLIYLIQAQYEKALNDFNKAISKQPSNFPYSYNNVGYVYLQQGKTDLAIKYFNECLSIRDRTIAANLNLALTYYIYGEQNKAIIYLERAKELDPDLQGIIDSATISYHWVYVYWTEKDRNMLAKMFEELR